MRDTYQWGAVDWNGYNANYSYDPLDNLRSNQLGASLLTYSYDSSNRLTQLSSGVGSQWSVSHDVRGNITANALRNQAYEFDLAHRLNAVTGKESYLYDGNGRRARTLNLQTGTIEYFGYGADGRLLQDWSNRRQVRNGYIYLGNTLVGLYVVDLTNNSNSAKYQHTDALGSPVVTTNASKTVLSRMSYTPYGMPTLPMDGVGYTGHFVDVVTQLTYMQQRYYDPAIGRFLSVDPMVIDTTTGWNFNRYNYAADNPYKFTDPDGRWIHLVGGAAIGALVGAGFEIYKQAGNGRPMNWSRVGVQAGRGAVVGFVAASGAALAGAMAADVGAGVVGTAAAEAALGGAGAGVSESTRLL